MTAIEMILAEYARLRGSGKEVKACLNVLRNDIEMLTEREKQDLVRLLHEQEMGEVQTVRAAPQPVPAITPLPSLDTTNSTRKFTLRNLAKERQAAEQEKNPSNGHVIWVNCRHCGHSNQKHELVCYSCGQLLESSKSQQETQALAETNDLSFSDDFFDQDSVLVIKVRASDQIFLSEPQKSDHELVIGRSAKGSAVMPDIDLADEDGDKLGVSRLHLNIRYDDRSRTISVSDMGSANGSYINGQRLHPHEVRVLRDHDELRLGKLVLLVSFQRQ
jgi:FHA domain-containing protein